MEALFITLLVGDEWATAERDVVPLVFIRHCQIEVQRMEESLD